MYELCADVRCQPSPCCLHTAAAITREQATNQHPYDGYDSLALEQGSSGVSGVTGYLGPFPTKLSKNKKPVTWVSELPVPVGAARHAIQSAGIVQY